MFNEKQIRYVRRQIINSFHNTSKAKAARFLAKEFGTMQVYPISQSEVLEHGDGQAKFLLSIALFYS